MILKLLKPHYWMLDRAFQGSNRYGVIVLITAALFLIERVVNAVSLDAMSTDSNVALLLFGGPVRCAAAGGAGCQSHALPAFRVA